MTRICQKKLAFYKLFKTHLTSPGEFLKTWEFVGEIYIVEIDRWELMSYKCPTRLTDIFIANPGLLDREWFTGKSGSSFYQYRIAKDFSIAKIRDISLLEPMKGAHGQEFSIVK